MLSSADTPPMLQAHQCSSGSVGTQKSCCRPNKGMIFITCIFTCMCACYPQVLTVCWAACPHALYCKELPALRVLGGQGMHLGWQRRLSWNSLYSPPCGELFIQRDLPLDHPRRLQQRQGWSCSPALTTRLPFNAHHLLTSTFLKRQQCVHSY